MVGGIFFFLGGAGEFFELVAGRLAGGGVVLMNIYAPGKERAVLVGPFIKTIRSALPGVAILDWANVIVLASADRGFDAASVRKRLEVPFAPGPLAQVASLALPALKEPQYGDDWPIFTDDRSDVEFRTFRTVSGPR